MDKRKGLGSYRSTQPTIYDYTECQNIYTPLGDWVQPFSSQQTPKSRISVFISKFNLTYQLI